MDIVVLTVPDCPNAPVLEARLAEVLGEIGSEVSIARHTIETAEQAARWGMRGSPTLLVNGADPFADPAVPPSVSCRMYRDEEGKVQGAPSVAALRLALRANVWSDPLGRAGAGRVAPVEGGLRAVHQRVLRSFADTGQAPTAAELAAVAEPYGREPGPVLAELHEADYLRLDQDGRVRAAYPFSAVPTPHLVQIDGGPQVFAMCAIDALGLAAMLGREVRIDSRDPVTGEQVIVALPAGTWEPETAVVFAGQHDACSSAAADVCCGYVNFFTGADTAKAWAVAHPEVTGQVLDQLRALELGVAIFGPLLRGDLP